MLRIMILSVLSGCLMVTVPAFAEQKETVIPSADVQAPKELHSNTSPVNQETVPTINTETLTLKSRQRLMEIAADIKCQRKSLADLASFVTWMTANLSGYSRYIQAGSLLAGFAKVLPIPYAGQASVLAKFIAQGMLSLNATSVSVSRYLATSREFVSRVDTLEQTAPAERPRKIAELSRLADDRLRRDMTDAHAKLKAASELSASTLSFLESLNHYLGSTDEYWNRTKSLITRNNKEKQEKSHLAQSIQNMRNRAAGFNGRLKEFEASTVKDESLIASLKVYDELIREMATMHAFAGQQASARTGI